MLEVPIRDICTVVTANSGTNEQAIRLHMMATPMTPVTLSAKNAATCSGVIVGDIGDENGGNRKYASRNSTAAGGTVHSMMRCPLVLVARVVVARVFVVVI